jgi:uncharacterized protein (DUF1778 family)
MEAEHDMAKPNHASHQGDSYPVVAKSYAADEARHIAASEPKSRSIVLTERDWEAFLAAWDDVDRPRPKLEALVKRYRNCHLSDVG